MIGGGEVFKLYIRMPRGKYSVPDRASAMFGPCLFRECAWRCTILPNIGTEVVGKIFFFFAEGNGMGGAKCGFCFFGSVFGIREVRILS